MGIECVRNRCFPLSLPDKSKAKTNTAQQAVQADTDKRQIFGRRRFSAKGIGKSFCCSRKMVRISRFRTRRAGMVSIT